MEKKGNYDAAQQLNRKAEAIVCDVSSPAEVEKLAAEVKEKFGRVDILVNNAGISKRSKLLESDDETWLEVIRVNLFGVYLCSKAFLPLMQMYSTSLEQTHVNRDQTTARYLAQEGMEKLRNLSFTIISTFSNLENLSMP